MHSPNLQEKVVTLTWSEVVSWKTISDCQVFAITFLKDESEVEIQLETLYVSFLRCLS